MGGLHSYDKAIADLDQAIALQPNFAAAYTNRGIAYRGKGAYDRAIADHDAKSDHATRLALFAAAEQACKGDPTMVEGEARGWS